MGNFYVNYTLRAVTQHAVADALVGRTCIVTPSAKDTVVAFDEASDAQDQRVISSLAANLSGKLRCPVLAVLNHDDDILWYQLYADGTLQDEYDSAPGYFDAAEDLAVPAGGDANILCVAFGSTKVADVERILRTSAFADDGYTFEVERHHALASALGISGFAVGTTFGSFDEGELPDGLSIDDVVRTT